MPCSYMQLHNMVKRGKKEIVTVDVWKENYEPLKEEAAARRYGISEYVNHKLKQSLERERFLLSYAPHLMVDTCVGSVMVLRDTKLKAFVELWRRDGTLHCTHHNSNDCIHTRYAWASVEVVGLFRDSPKKGNSAEMMLGVTNAMLIA